MPLLYQTAPLSHALAAPSHVTLSTTKRLTPRRVPIFSQKHRSSFQESTKLQMLKEHLEKLLREAKGEASRAREERDEARRERDEARRECELKRREWDQMRRQRGDLQRELAQAHDSLREAAQRRAQPSAGADGGGREAHARSQSAGAIAPRRVVARESLGQRPHGRARALVARAPSHGMRGGPRRCGAATHTRGGMKSVR